MEELELTEPVEKTITKYRVMAVTLSLETVMDVVPGAVLIDLRDNNNAVSHYQYTGQIAVDMIKALNTANLSTKSLHKRILERLAADGHLPGTVTGAPDA